MPSLVVYWYFVIEAPPLNPAVKVMEAEALPGVVLRPVGADGALTAAVGVTDTADDAVPPPALL